MVGAPVFDLLLYGWNLIKPLNFYQDNNFS